MTKCKAMTGWSGSGNSHPASAAGRDPGDRWDHALQRRGCAEAHLRTVRGERARLIFLPPDDSKTEFLVLDEPTNNLEPGSDQCPEYRATEIRRYTAVGDARRRRAWMKWPRESGISTTERSRTSRAPTRNFNSRRNARRGREHSARSEEYCSRDFRADQLFTTFD